MLGSERRRNNLSKECSYKALQRSRDYTVEARVTQVSKDCDLLTNPEASNFFSPFSAPPQLAYTHQGNKSAQGIFSFKLLGLCGADPMGFLRACQLRVGELGDRKK